MPEFDICDIKWETSPLNIQSVSLESIYDIVNDYLFVHSFNANFILPAILKEGFKKPGKKFKVCTLNPETNNYTFRGVGSYNPVNHKINFEAANKLR